MYSLRKSKAMLRHVYHLYLRKKKRLTSFQKEETQGILKSLEQAIQNKDRAKADSLSRNAESLQNLYLKKSSFEKCRDLILGLGFALFVAVLVRQMWFEFYEIPTGSMRPTLKEQDRLVVSKTDFGINLPLTTKHIYFDPSLVNRGGIFIFTGENMDIRDVDTLYFYLFPGKKQYVKRLMGKPEDTLYFYGGKIYGIDKEGKDITAELQQKRLEKIEHIPFIYFEGRPHFPRLFQGIYNPSILYQMNEPVAKLSLTPQNQLQGEMLPPFSNVSDYAELWGFKNFAKARLLTKEQVKQLTNQDISSLADAPLYLELRHSPSFSSLKLGSDYAGRLSPAFQLTTSVLPLQEKQLRTLFNNLYTARFNVKDGLVFRYGSAEPKKTDQTFSPLLPNVPNGMYEFYYGKAYSVKSQGVTFELPPSHPLSQFSPELLQLLFNVGIECDMRFAPQTKNQSLFPARYAYYREGDLYVLGAPLLSKESPELAAFLQSEKQKPRPFEDFGPPLKVDGTLDKERIKKNGLHIPPKSYLALGDNHAMSSDSRDFGFVPEDNIRGGPSFIFWPPGNRFGIPNQPPYPWINFPRSVIWAAAAFCIGGWILYHRKRNRLDF